MRGSKVEVEPDVSLSPDRAKQRQATHHSWQYLYVLEFLALDEDMAEEGGGAGRERARLAGRAAEGKDGAPRTKERSDGAESWTSG